MPKTIAIDFDGVLHKYSKGWQDGSIYDGPMDGAIEAIHKLLHKKNLNIVIFTSRSDKEIVREWLKEWFNGWEPEIHYKPMCSVLIDDRAIRFTNWKDILNYF